MLTADEMKITINRTIAALKRFGHLSGFTDEKDQAAPNGPADRPLLQRLASELPYKLPPSYLQLLSLHDGIRNFYWVDAELLPASNWFNDPAYAKDWDRPHMFFFILGNDWNGAAFDTRTANSAGEMEVQEFEGNMETVRWPTLSDFLVGYRDRVEGWLAKADADRAQIEDE